MRIWSGLAIAMRALLRREGYLLWTLQIGEIRFADAPLRVKLPLRAL
jgi:hypothetical protein